MAAFQYLLPYCRNRFGTRDVLDRVEKYTKDNLQLYDALSGFQLHSPAGFNGSLTPPKLPRTTPSHISAKSIQQNPVSPSVGITAITKVIPPG
ncbi:hypothetical protein J6590_029360 [Homalodisca vitripennis]|nr:hypothetical protein J6590_029360 [Homalodisca vitripennis]